jgi:hypothetical protein
MYNALGGLGGSGQVDPTVAANATVALLSATAGTALFVVGPLFSYTGPRICFLLGGWTYALYSGSLLNFNREIPRVLCKDSADSHQTTTMAHSSLPRVPFWASVLRCSGSCKERS